MTDRKIDEAIRAAIVNMHNRLSELADRPSDITHDNAVQALGDIGDLIDGLAPDDVIEEQRDA